MKINFIKEYIIKINQTYKFLHFRKPNFMKEKYDD
jgi:hypothetical protein